MQDAERYTWDDWLLLVAWGNWLGKQRRLQERRAQFSVVLDMELHHVGNRDRAAYRFRPLGRGTSPYSRGLWVPRGG